jgi:dynein heavy chain
LLQAGADPTQTVDDFAVRRKKPSMNKVSMGEAQEIPAKEKIKEGHMTGRWLLLSNCQLSLELMAEMETILNPTDKEVHPDFRLWITCEADVNFPLGLLQMSIKNAFVPPKGIVAGLSRTFNTEINPDFLERVEPIEKWKNIVFTVCFMHSIILERRKFGPLGFTVPYEFNYGDMLASLTFIEKHMNACFANQQKESWKAIRYITCEVQYGGRITDNMDREMFSTYGDLWLDDPIFKPGYNFNPNSEFAYKIPETTEHAKFLEHVSTLPSNDSPAIFGLNNLADLTFRLNESAALINTLVDVQPKDSGSGGGLSRED